jgi:hypothetical protein
MTQAEKNLLESLPLLIELLGSEDLFNKHFLNAKKVIGIIRKKWPTVSYEHMSVLYREWVKSKDVSEEDFTINSLIFGNDYVSKINEGTFIIAALRTKYDLW